MALQIFKEPFVGNYDGVTPATMLPPGSLVDGENVRKVSLGGGWKPRKGCLLYNPSNVLESGTAIKSLHQYSNPRNVSTDTDYHFIAQVNSKLVNLEGAIDAAPAYTGEASLGVTVGTTPGFSCVVGEDWVYADGSGVPIIYGGANPFCTGFLTSNDVTGDHPVIAADYTRVVTDKRDTLATIGATANDGYLVCSSEKASGIKLDLVTVNTTDTTTIKVYTWQSSGWVELTSGTHTWVDGTLDNGKTHAKDGTISWVTSSSDTMRVFGGIMGYWYKVVPQAALQDGVTVKKCQVTRIASTITNKWNGVWNWVAGCRFYDSSETEYVDVFGKISNESTGQYLDISSAQDDGDDFIYIKTVEPATGFGFGMVPDYQNTGAASKVDLIQYWNGIAWANAGVTSAIVDTTLDGGSAISFSQSGSMFFDAAAITPVRRTFEGDNVPGYWYRVEWSADIGTDVRIFMILAATFPEAIPTYDGCVEFKGRLFVWGDPEFPNRMRYSAYNKPDCFSGMDSHYTDTFGGMDKVLCAIKFYNELIVFKKNSVWLLEGYSPQTFGTLRIADTIGLASPKSAIVAEVGSPTMHKDEPLSIAVWQDTDGIYVLDGRKPRKASLPIGHYFDMEYSTTVIAAASISDRQAFIDPLKNEYHFLLPAGELVYNYATDEWYPPWEREIDLTTGVVLRGSDNRYYTYGGSGAGWVMLLENDTTDKTVANADKAISHSVKTRAISALQKGGTTLRFNFRKVWAELKARASATTGLLTTNFFKNMATTGSEITTPTQMSIVASGVSVTVPEQTTSQEGCSCFQLEFSLDAVDEEMEIWGILYELEVIGEIGS